MKKKKTKGFEKVERERSNYNDAKDSSGAFRRSSENNIDVQLEEGKAALGGSMNSSMDMLIVPGAIPRRSENNSGASGDSAAPWWRRVTLRSIAKTFLYFISILSGIFTIISYFTHR